MPIPDDLRATLAAHQQEHLLRWWDDLDADGRAKLIAQLAACDFAEIARLTTGSADDSDSPRDKALRAVPPRDLVRLDELKSDPGRAAEAEDVGNEMLARGEVGALVVAGGQGTRLGFPRAKGLFPIGPVSGSLLIECLCGQIRSRQRRSGQVIPYFIMTSDATHDEMVAAFAEHDHFGLDPDHVFFFRQGNMPAVSAEEGRLLLADKDSLALSPDGHGGLVAALRRSGLFEELRRRGVRTLFYHQVDNPCAILCDPVFLGLHRLAQSELSTKAVAKRDAAEKMGVLVDVDGRTQIIEYSDMPESVSAQTEPDGSLRFWAGNTATHAMEVDFLERISTDSMALPFHRARKKVPYLDESGTRVEPATENAWKFERFIFDALPCAKRALVVEADRKREFNPVKNASGNDSPETCRAALKQIWRDWLTAAGISFPAEATLEIPFDVAIDASDLARHWPRGTVLSGGEIILHSPLP